MSALAAGAVGNVPENGQKVGRRSFDTFDEVDIIENLCQCTHDWVKN
jgi:hypothetical protein